MEKVADVITPLQPHQQRVVERIREQPGLVVAHGLGSGKTLSSIAMAEALGGPVNVIVPAALMENYNKEVAKHVRSPKAEYRLSTLQKAGLGRAPDPTDTLIVDEAHRLRDNASKARQILQQRAKEYKKRILLSATPVYNQPGDIASLVNLAAGKNVLPATHADFDRKFVRETKVKPSWWQRKRGATDGVTRQLTNTEELRGVLQKWVDYHENSREGFPDRINEQVRVPMSKKQFEVYQTMMDQAPPWLRMKVRAGLPPSKQEAQNLNAFAAALRQASISTGSLQQVQPLQAAEDSTKIRTAVARLKARAAADPDHRAVVYSNYLDAGLRPYAAKLDAEGIPYGMFTGEQSKAAREQMVRDYNEGKIKALLLSSAGGEGLDLKGTRQIQMLEPHWNDAKIDQIIGRGIRYKSHAHLPADRQNVKVETYLSETPEPGFFRKLVQRQKDKAIDEYLLGLSEEKTRLNDQVLALMKRSALGTNTRRGVQVPTYLHKRSFSARLLGDPTSGTTSGAGTAAANAVGFGLGGALVTPIVTEIVGYPGMVLAEPTLNMKQLEALRDVMVRPVKGRDLLFTMANDGRPGNAHFVTYWVNGQRDRKVIVPPTSNAYSALHELGHAQDMGSWSQARHLRYGKMRRSIMPVRGAMVGAAGAVGYLSEDPRVQIAAAAAPAVVTAPILLSEAKATWYGDKALRKLKAMPAPPPVLQDFASNASVGKYRLNLGSAFLTYATPALLAPVMVGIASAKRKRDRDAAARSTTPAPA